MFRSKMIWILWLRSKTTIYASVRLARSPPVLCPSNSLVPGQDELIGQMTRRSVDVDEDVNRRAGFAQRQPAWRLAPESVPSGADVYLGALRGRRNQWHFGGMIFQAASGWCSRYSRARGATSHNPQPLRLVIHPELNFWATPTSSVEAVGVKKFSIISPPPSAVVRCAAPIA